MTRVRIEHILCPIDFSVFSARAIRHANALAKRFDARLTVLHVIPKWVPYAASPLDIPALKPASPNLRDLVDDEMRTFVKPAVHDDVTVRTVVREGEPWREIQAMAETLPADLVVMGTHGRGGFEHLVLGSVTEKILCRAPCPVLTVCHEEGRTWETPGLIRRILCATDLSNSSNAAMKFAFALAHEHGATLVLVHVVEALAPSGDPEYLTMPETKALRQRIESLARNQLSRTILESPRNTCEIVERVVGGRAHREILRIAVEEAVDMIVMGARPHPVLAQAVFGSTSHHVVREATCPVLTVRPLSRLIRGRQPKAVAKPARLHR
jgi:nucleotide-binding universal stress UspA family protein